MPAIEREHLIKRSLNTFLILFLVLGSLLGGMIVVFYHLQTRNHDKRLCAEERHSVDLQVTVVRHHFDSILSDLAFLVGQEELQAYFGGSDESLLLQVGREYQTFSAGKRIYDQIRFLDETGRERVRVNYHPETPEIVSPGQLQDKSKRYYFTDAFKLPEGERFISPLDLNIEHGRVEEPFKPMIRFGAPVYDRSGSKRGIVLLNYLGKNLLDLVQDVSSVAQGQTMLVNDDGYWLKHPDPAKEWGFMLADRAKQSFAREFPQLWQQILEKPSGQLRTAEGVYTFATISPFTGSLSGMDPKGLYNWKIISFISADRLASYSKSLLINLFVLGAGLFLLAASVAWFLAMTITRRKIYQAQLISMAHFDTLTGLPNRTLFFDRLEQALSLANRYGRLCALLYIDLDGFKGVNDSLGHDAGDELLTAVGQRMAKCCRRSDSVARLGGDEFAVLLTEVSSAEGARIFIEKLLNELHLPFRLKQGEVQVGASIGVGLYPAHGTTLEALLKNADQAMYTSKSRGKNCYTFFGENESATDGS